MRRFFILLLGAMMAFTLVACDKDDSNPSSAPTASDKDNIFELPEDPF